MHVSGLSIRYLIGFSTIKIISHQLDSCNLAVGTQYGINISDAPGAGKSESTIVVWNHGTVYYHHVSFVG